MSSIRSNDELTKDLYTFYTATHVAQVTWRPTEDVGNYAQGGPGTPLWTAYLGCARWRKGWTEAHRTWTFEPWEPLSEVWYIPLVMLARPTPGECRHMYKYK